MREDKKLPFEKAFIDQVADKYGTPFYIYDEKAIIENAQNFKKAFDRIPGGIKNFFAVKACPNPYIIKILKTQGFGADCSSFPELVMADKIGLKSENIMLTSNNTSLRTFKKASELGVIINFDDISFVDYYEKNVGKLPEIGCFRYNPGKLRTGNNIIGKPEESKYGLTHEQIFKGYKMLKDRGVKRFGIHTMIVSNMLDIEYLADTAKMLFELIVEINKKLGIRFEFVNLGGGFGIPYSPDQKKLDLKKLSSKIKAHYKNIIIKNGLDPLKIYTENGRFMTGPYGYLVSTVRHVMKKYRNYVGINASMSDLMRPGIYGAYHHISVLGKERMKSNNIYDVVGSLCENNDKFAIQRKLPKIDEGDILVIHDVGAHGYAMGFNYNGILCPKELLLQKNGKVKLVRREETIDDYFTTLKF